LIGRYDSENVILKELLRLRRVCDESWRRLKDPYSTLERQAAVRADPDDGSFVATRLRCRGGAGAAAPQV